MRARAAPARVAPTHGAQTHARTAQSMALLDGPRKLSRPPSRWVGEIADASVSNSWAALLPGGPADDHAGEKPSRSPQPTLPEAARLVHVRLPPCVIRSTRRGAERQALCGPIAVGHAAGARATTERYPADRAVLVRHGHPAHDRGQLRDDGVGVSPRRDAPPRGHLEVGLHRLVREGLPGHLHLRAADQGARVRLPVAPRGLPARRLVPARLCGRHAGMLAGRHCVHNTPPW